MVRGRRSESRVRKEWGKGRQRGRTFISEGGKRGEKVVKRKERVRVLKTAAK